MNHNQNITKPEPPKAVASSALLAAPAVEIEYQDVVLEIRLLEPTHENPFNREKTWIKYKQKTKIGTKHFDRNFIVLECLEQKAPHMLDKSEAPTA